MCCVLSHVWLFATPCTVSCQPFCSWNFPGKNTRMGYHSLLQGIFPPRDWIRVSCVSCIGRRPLYHCTTREAQDWGRKGKIRVLWLKIRKWIEAARSQIIFHPGPTSALSWNGFLTAPAASVSFQGKQGWGPTVFARGRIQQELFYFWLEYYWYTMLCFRYTAKWFSYTLIYSSRFFSHIGYYRILSRSPCAIQ